MHVPCMNYNNLNMYHELYYIKYWMIVHVIALVFCRLLAVPSGSTTFMWPEHAKSCIWTVIQNTAQLECTAVMFRVSMARATSLLSMYPKQTTQVSTLPLASVSDCTLIVSINHACMCYIFSNAWAHAVCTLI